MSFMDKIQIIGVCDEKDPKQVESMKKAKESIEKCIEDYFKAHVVEKKD